VTHVTGSWTRKLHKDGCEICTDMPVWADISTVLWRWTHTSRYATSWWLWDLHWYACVGWYQHSSLKVNSYYLVCNVVIVVRSALVCLCGLISAQFSEDELILFGMQRRENCVPYSPTCFMVTQRLCTICLECSGLGSGRCVRFISYHVSSCHISLSNCMFWLYAGWIGFRF